MLTIGINLRTRLHVNRKFIMEKYFPFSSRSLDGSIIFFYIYTKIKRRQRCEWEKSISSAVETHTDFSSVCCILDGKNYVWMYWWKSRMENARWIIKSHIDSLKFLIFTSIWRLFLAIEFFYITLHQHHKQPSTLHESFIHCLFTSRLLQVPKHCRQCKTFYFLNI